MNEIHEVSLISFGAKLDSPSLYIQYRKVRMAHVQQYSDPNSAVEQYSTSDQNILSYIKSELKHL